MGQESERSCRPLADHLDDDRCIGEYRGWQPDGVLCLSLQRDMEQRLAGDGKYIYNRLGGGGHRQIKGITGNRVGEYSDPSGRTGDGDAANGRIGGMPLLVHLYNAIIIVAGGGFGIGEVIAAGDIRSSLYGAQGRPGGTIRTVFYHKMCCV